jgi:hypothetical protein
MNRTIQAAGETESLSRSETGHVQPNTGGRWFESSTGEIL